MHALSGLGANEHTQGSPGVGALPEESLNLGEWPEEDQVSVYGEEFPSHHEASHLEKEPCFRHIRNLHRTKGVGRLAAGIQSVGKGPKMGAKK